MGGLRSRQHIRLPFLLLFILLGIKKEEGNGHLLQAASNLRKHFHSKFPMLPFAFEGGATVLELQNDNDRDSSDPRALSDFAGAAAHG